MIGHLLAIDQGTTSSRAILFSSKLDVVAIAQKEFTQHFPQSGWVEHDPEDIWATTIAVVNEVLARADISARAVAALGITNQRETTVVWNRTTGKAVHNAIVWQDRRTADLCAQLREDGLEKDVLTFANLRMPLNDAGTTEIYSFGGFSHRDGTGNAFRRYFDNERNWQEIYPLGFLPTFSAEATDYSAAGGLRGGHRQRGERAKEGKREARHGETGQRPTTRR